MPGRIEQCGRCGTDVQWRPHEPGGLSGGWVHLDGRDDHHVVHGEPMTPEKWAEIKRQMALHGKIQKEEEGPDNTIIPEPEVRATPIDIGDPRLPGGAKQILKLARSHGWKDRTTYSRGPWMHATHWTVVSISDLVLVRLIKDRTMLSASWRDGKFNIAWCWTEPGPALNSAQLKARIKGEDTTSGGTP